MGLDRNPIVKNVSNNRNSKMSLLASLSSNPIKSKGEKNLVVKIEID